MKKQRRRIIVLGVGGAVLALAAGLTLQGLSASVSYFVSPAEIVSGAVGARAVKLGGLVEGGSVRRQGTLLEFTVTDLEGAARVRVRYEGQPPDLFRENQGVVAEGRVQPDGSFLAERVLAKHDETYMPREVAKTLQARGEWRGPSLEAPAQ